MEQNMNFFSLKTMTERQYSFQKLTHFSQGDKLHFALPSNFDGFLSRVTCLSSSQLIAPIWNKMCISPPFEM
jgi:hypothetical protein